MSDLTELSGDNFEMNIQELYSQMPLHFLSTELLLAMDNRPLERLDEKMILIQLRLDGDEKDGVEFIDRLIYIEGIDIMPSVESELLRKLSHYFNLLNKLFNDFDLIEYQNTSEQGDEIALWKNLSPKQQYAQMIATVFSKQLIREETNSSFIYASVLSLFMTNASFFSSEIASILSKKIAEYGIKQIQDKT
jgi:hypothetical protein